MSLPGGIHAHAFLIVAGLTSGVASLAHVAVIVGGPPWYRAFGAGEAMARAAGQGSFVPAILTAGIAIVLAAFAAYAFAGAGLIGRLPAMRPALVLISVIYMARGVIVLKPSLLFRPDLSTDFVIRSSLIVLVIGLLHVIGTVQAWHRL